MLIHHVCFNVLKSFGDHTSGSVIFKSILQLTGGGWGGGAVLHLYDWSNMFFILVKIWAAALWISCSCLMLFPGSPVRRLLKWSSLLEIKASISFCSAWVMKPFNPIIFLSYEKVVFVIDFMWLQRVRSESISTSTVLALTFSLERQWLCLLKAISFSVKK